MLGYQTYSNLEMSLKYFLTTEINTDSVTDKNGINITVRLARKKENDWSIPCVLVYHESETSPKFEIGSNLTDDRFLIIIDIVASNERERKDVARWLKEKLKNGCTYYTYTYNGSDPENPTKSSGGWININFVTNTRVNLGQNVDIADAHKHRISISTWISGS